MGSQFEDEVLEGDGFRLSPLDSGDVADVTSACRDETTQRWLPLPAPYTADAARAFIADIAPEMHTSGAGLVRRIEIAGRLCGVIDLKKTDWLVRQTEIGYWVAPWARGRGLAGKASKVLADWALSDQNMARVVIHCASGNQASQKAAVVGRVHSRRSRAVRRIRSLRKSRPRRLQQDLVGPGPRVGAQCRASEAGHPLMPS